MVSESHNLSVFLSTSTAATVLTLLWTCPPHSDLNRRAKQVPNHKAKIELLGSYDPQKQVIIKDPYYVSIQTESFIVDFSPSFLAAK